MKYVKIILVISIALNIVASYFVVKKMYWKYYAFQNVNAQKSLPSSKIAYYLNRQELFEVFPKDSNSIIFLGNSLTQNFELAELFHNLNVKNRGISGDVLLGVLNRIKPIIEEQPKKIFIEIGINDIGHGVTKETVLKNYQSLVDTLQKECKQTKIYIQSVFPVNNMIGTFLPYGDSKVNSDIMSINEGLLEYAMQHDITFIDTYSKFVLDGQLNPKYTIDGIHLSGEGYLLWKTILTKYVEE